MTFPTLDFAVFFAVVLPVSWVLMPRPRLWKPFMIAASYYFYSCAGDPHLVLLLAAETIWNQFFALVIYVPHRSERARSWLLATAVAGDLVLLGWFKYYGFFVGNVAA